jgi:uncharacterized protein (DUF58 family)
MPANKVRESFSDRVAGFLASRAKRADRFILGQHNVYIFPTKSGFAFLALLLLMLVTAINYQSSLIYLVVFLLGVLFFISIWLCFLNLQGLEVTAGSVSKHFANQDCQFDVLLRHSQRNVYGLQYGVFKGVLEERSLHAGESLVVVASAGRRARGVYRLEKILLESSYPFGWIRAWTWLKLNAESIVYPAMHEPPEQKVGEGGEHSAPTGVTSLDRDTLRNFRVGDTLGHVHWKKFASSGQLVVKDSAQVTPAVEWLRWDYYDGYASEQRLSFLCSEIVSRSEDGVVFGLELPGRIVQPSIGSKHRDSCLFELAKYGAAGAGPILLRFDGRLGAGADA